MNTQQLSFYLQQMGISPRLYAIGSIGGGECLCLTCNYQPKDEGGALDAEPGEGWEVAFSERGYRSSIEKFATETQACLYFMQNVIVMAQEADYKGPPLDIITIDWLSQEAEEAEVTLSDGNYQCVAFCHPCRYQPDDKTGMPLYLFDDCNIRRSRNENHAIHSHKTKAHPDYHEIRGQLVLSSNRRSRLLRAGRFRFHIEENTIPKDIQTGDWIELVTSRITLL